MSDLLEDLQMKSAHQEVALDALNEVVVQQGKLIDELRAELDEVKRELRDLRPSLLGSEGAGEPPPPHY